jgi:hypothetical protein
VALDVTETGNDMYKIEIWLGETLGSFKDRWNAVYKHNGTDFYFRQGQDATMFALKWS